MVRFMTGEGDNDSSLSNAESRTETGLGSTELEELVCDSVMLFISASNLSHLASRLFPSLYSSIFDLYKSIKVKSNESLAVFKVWLCQNSKPNWLLRI
ncbi:hypothetical protein Hanom_Chr00s000002g01599501 [Helianthus anomalus]